MKDYADITLDKPRRLRYRWQDIRDLTRRLGGVTLQDLLAKLGAADPETISVAMLLGLRHEQPRITMEQIDELLDAYFRREEPPGRLGDILNAITEAIQASGLLRDRSKPTEPEGDRPT